MNTDHGGPGSTGPLRVAVNLLWCVPGDVGGSEEYLVRQLRGLSARSADTDSAVALTLFVLRPFVDAHPDLCTRNGVMVLPSSGRRRAARVVAEHTWLARRTQGFDLVHHGGGTLPRLGTRPTVLTIHDLQFLEHPEYHSRLKLRYLRAVVPRSARTATRVVTPTDWVRRTVIDELAVAGERVDVVPHGVGPDVGHDTPDESTLRARYGLGGGPVVVYPAITHPHKGHRFLLEVMARHWTDPDLRLVLPGGAGAADAEVRAAIERLGLTDRVVRPGRVPAADRDGLVRLATALAFPSEYEGFGAPLVEAMRLDTPVVAAEHPAVSEVVADAGLVLPRSIDAWAGALDVVDRRRDELVEAGRRRAEHYTEAASGRALADVYRRAVGTDSRRVGA